MADHSHSDPRTRLPLTHPDFRYSRTKNPYQAKLLKHADIAYSDNEAESHAGKWREQFAGSPAANRAKELHVEIGCNTGHVVREWARANPQHLYVGIDWKFKIVHQGVEKAKAKDLKNILFFRGNVERIGYMFGSAEVDAAYLYFPDPWPKKAQLKNRFVKPETLRALGEIIKPGGLFHIKTDHDGYFEWMLEAIAQVPEVWSIERLEHDLHGANPKATELKIPDVTLFEGLFIKDGIKIKSVWLRRR